MAKLKLRYREQILQALSQAKSPIPLRTILKAIFPKEELKNPKFEHLISKELRYLIKMKEVEKGAGNLFRIRPPKSNRAKREREREGSTFTDREDKREQRDFKNSHVVSPRPKKPHGTVIRGKVSKNNRGFAFVAPENPPPFLKEDVFLNPEEAEDLLTGDVVEIVLDDRRAEKGYSGRFLRFIERGLQKVVARYVKGNSFNGSIAEVDTKDLQIQIALDPDPIFKDTVDGAAIIVQVTQSPSGGSQARGKILSVLADSLNSTTDDPYIIIKHKLRETFPDEVMAEANAVPNVLQKSDYKDRQDLREIPFVTIDGADARDFDDAVCAKKMANGSTRLWVAVADVAHYVKPGMAMDKEAYERGTSVYFPHRVLPMLPERLSNGLCSLNPHEDRLAMVCEMDFDPSGKKIRHKVYEAIFQSQHRCVYETVQQFFDRPREQGYDYNPAVRESLTALFELYKKLQVIRTKRGSVDLNLPEAKVKVNRETGEVDTIVRTERLDAHRLIEEFMIAANEAVSEMMIEAKWPFIFRVHETPEEEAAQRFIDVAKTLHVKVNEKWISDLTPYTYQKMLRAIEESPSSRVLNFLLLRSMKQAYYSSENLRHFGLASQAYSHFTSPIRRYPDLIVHRCLKAFIHRNKKEALAAGGSIAKNLEEASVHCSARERLAVDAERELIRIKQVRYAERHLGEEHTGTIVGINAKGAYVELADVFIEGFVPIERFGPDFIFNEKLYHLRGKRTGNIVQIGDKIDVQIVRTTPHLLQIELEPLKGPKKKKHTVSHEQRGNKTVPVVRDFWTPEDFE